MPVRRAAEGSFGGRFIPATASAALVVAAMAWTLWLAPWAGAAPRGRWLTPGDLWRTFEGADLLVHGHLSSLYGSATTLVTLPGVLVMLAPAAAVVSAAGLGFGVPFTQLAHPSAWLVLGPAAVGLCCPALFALDGWARRLAVPVARRWVLALVELVLIWNVAVQWGHPEDCLAIAGLLWALAATADGRRGAAAWWLGAACAVQPLVLLALPVVMAAVPARQVPGWLARVVLVPALVLAAPLAANWGATVHAVVDQPNYPTVDHITPWIALAPHLPGEAVSAGPGRLVALVLALACFVPARSAWADRRAPDARAAVLWWAALALALRVGFESVMVAYYLWPPLAVALVVAGRRRRCLMVGTVAAIATSVFANLDLHWQGRWAWWAVTTAGTAVAVAAGWWAAAPPRTAVTRPGAVRLAAGGEVPDSPTWT